MKISPIHMALAIIYLLFFVIGLLVVFPALQLYLSQWFVMPIGMNDIGFGLVLIVFGSGGLIQLVWALKQSRRYEEKLESCGDAPWLFDKQWARNKIHSYSNSFASLAVGWFFTLFWNGFCFFMVQQIWSDKAASLDISIIVLMFSAVGVFLLAFSIYLTMCWYQHRKAFLVLDTMPGRIGGRLSGRIVLPIQSGGFTQAMLSFKCCQIDTEREHTTIIWEAELFIDEEKVVADIDNLQIPFSFSIPVDALPTRVLSDKEGFVGWEIYWRTNRGFRGIQAEFSVPVFPATESDAVRLTEAQQNCPTANYKTPPIPNTFFKTKFAIQSSGKKEIYLPMRSWKDESVTSFILSCFFGFTLWPIYRAGGPFVILWAIFFLLCLYGFIDYTFRFTRVEIGPNEFTITQGWFMSTIFRKISRDEVLDIRHKFLFGSSYDIILELRNEKNFKVFSGITSQLEADWIVNEMKSTPLS